MYAAGIIGKNKSSLQCLHDIIKPISLLHFLQTRLPVKNGMFSYLSICSMNRIIKNTPTANMGNKTTFVK